MNGTSIFVLALQAGKESGNSPVRKRSSLVALKMPTMTVTAMRPNGVVASAVPAWPGRGQDAF